jgi:hypothetical protein
VIVREFTVNVGCEKDFELVFGPGGIWPELLQPRSEGYSGTELQLVSERCYRVLDWWKSHRDFELFREQCQHDVEEFRKWLLSKGLVVHEAFLGSFYTAGPDEDAGLVSA